MAEESTLQILYRRRRELIAQIAALRGQLAPRERELEQVDKMLTAVGSPLDASVELLPQRNSNAVMTDYAAALRPLLELDDKFKHMAEQLKTATAVPPEAIERLKELTAFPEAREAIESLKKAMEGFTTQLAVPASKHAIGRNTAFTYKGKHVDLKQIGRELNVRYLLEGSVQRSGSRMRVNVQLIDAETGNHLWAERFDKPLADLFDMQDEIVARLANQISTELIVAEARRAERSPHPDSMDLYFQGMAFLNHGPSLENLSQARAHFERAVALDPANVDALVGMAAVDYLIGAGYMSDDHAARLAAAEAAVTKVLSLAPNHAWAHMYLGGIQAATGRANQGLAECERALVLDRNLARAHAHIGYAKILLGRAEEVEDHAVESLRLSPRDSAAYVAMYVAGGAKLLLGKDEEAVAWLRRSIEANRNFRNAHVSLAAALAQLGRLDEARAAVQAALALDPTLTVRRYRAGIVGDNPTFLTQLERGIDGMRKVGVPEG